MSSNDTNNTLTLEERGETFHIYILSFSYGFLLLIILIHLMVRWQWKRVTTSQFSNHFPGDKSFKCKAVRHRLRADFTNINTLIPDPNLINENYKPEIFGRCKDGSAVPDHWYRMRTCEAANKFVTSNGHLLRPSHTPPTYTAPSQRYTRIGGLPDFIAKMKKTGQIGFIDEAAQGMVDTACDLYTAARYSDGEFGKSQFEEFSGYLQQIQDMLKPGTGMSPVSFTSLPRRFDLLQPSDALELRRMSQEPLLASLTSDPSSSSTPHFASDDPRSHRQHHHQQQHHQHQHLQHRREEAPELSPLILVETQSGADPEGSYFNMPETPV